MLLDFIVCDDIRNEQGDKSTLVGVYGEILRIARADGQPVSWPVLLPKLGVFLRTKPVGDFAPDRFVLTYTHNGAKIGRVEGPMVIVDPSRPYTIAAVAAPFPLPGPGKIQFQLSFQKGDITRQVVIDRAVVIEVEGGEA